MLRTRRDFLQASGALVVMREPPEAHRRRQASRR
jgi:hypothetical protein